jgi:4a-hydroxytetrahydrobiopterin dehydratase
LTSVISAGGRIVFGVIFASALSDWGIIRPNQTGFCKNGKRPLLGKTMAQLLTESEIQNRLSQLSGWELDGKTIKCVRKFGGFPEAVAFVNTLVDPAEAAGHHPDLAIAYNTVTVSLSTHDAGGLTEKDFAMAATISTL